MKTFEIGVWEEQGGYLSVEAADEKEAGRIAKEFICDYGFDIMDREPNSYPQVKGLRTTHRDTYLV